MNLLPSEKYRFAMRLDDVGNDVGVLQLNLGNLIVDGVFGVQTEAAVSDWQRAHNLKRDGIAGPATQQSLIVQLSRPAAQANGLPGGMLKSIAFNESGFAIAAAGPHAGDDGWDVGAFARSSGSTFPGQEFLRSAYDVAASARWTADNLVESRREVGDPIRSEYLADMAEGDRNNFKWMLVILSHNWPVAAQNISRIGTAMKTAGADDKPADWIVTATNGRLSTPREWCLAYVARATVYVKWR